MIPNICSFIKLTVEPASIDFRAPRCCSKRRGVRNFFEEPCLQVVLQTVCNTSAEMAFFFSLLQRSIKSKINSSLWSLALTEVVREACL